MYVYSRILLMLGFYKPGLIVCHKYFPFKVPWRPHNNGYRCHVAVRSVHATSVYATSIQIALSCIIFPLQLPPSPYGSVISKWKDSWGDDSIWILRDLSVFDKLAWNYFWCRGLKFWQRPFWVTWLVCPPVGTKTSNFHQGTRGRLGWSFHP